jgi:hypothetical protein
MTMGRRLLGQEGRSRIEYRSWDYADGCLTLGELYYSISFALLFPLASIPRCLQVIQTIHTENKMKKKENPRAVSILACSLDKKHQIEDRDQNRYQ